MPPTELERDLLQQPKLQRLFALWNRKRGERPMPARREIDTVELREWLGHLILVESVDAGASFRYRVYGTKLVELFGHELTGKTVSHFASTRQPLITGDYERVRRDRSPVYYDRPGVVRGEYVRVHVLALPLSSDGIEVDMILAATYPERGKRSQPRFAGSPATRNGSSIG